MNEAPWNAALKRISYRKGWSFKIDSIGNQLTLRILINTDDAYTGLGTTVNAEFYFPWKDETDFILRVQESIMKFELHESMEFFKVDHLSIFSPDHNKAPWKVPEGIKLHD